MGDTLLSNSMKSTFTKFQNHFLWLPTQLTRNDQLQLFKRDVTKKKQCLTGNLHDRTGSWTGGRFLYSDEHQQWWLLSLRHVSKVWDTSQQSNSYLITIWKFRTRDFPVGAAKKAGQVALENFSLYTCDLSDINWNRGNNPNTYLDHFNLLHSLDISFVYIIYLQMSN